MLSLIVKLLVDHLSNAKLNSNAIYKCIAWVINKMETEKSLFEDSIKKLNTKKQFKRRNNKHTNERAVRLNWIRMFMRNNYLLNRPKYTSFYSGN